MSLFDKFKKSPKKEPGKEQNSKAGKPWNDNPLASPEMQKKRYEAALDFLQFFEGKTPLLGGKPHAGTVLSIAACLAGTSLFRAVNKKDFPPDVVVLSEEVNEAYPRLLNLFALYCKQNGIDVMAKPVVTEFPEKDKPLMELAQIRAEYQAQYNEIMKKHGLDYLESARAGIVISSILFSYHCIKNKDIDPYVATGIVAMGVIEGAKTSPSPLKAEKASVTPKNDPKENQAANLIRTIAESSISGSGTRLVFGEKDAAIQDALSHGGMFILVHPEVESKLKQGNIDPYVVYVTALIIQMESKIDQIDFVGGDVDQSAKEWNGKPEKSIPNSIRQMLWLKENAQKYGYQQSENSWKLKQ